MFISELMLYFANNKCFVALLQRVGRCCVPDVIKRYFRAKNGVSFFAIAVICEKSFNFVKNSIL